MKPSRFFAKLEGIQSSPSPLHPLGMGFLTQYFTHFETNLIHTKSISAFADGWKHCLSCETIKCTFEIVNWGWKSETCRSYSNFHKLGGHYYY